MSLTAGKEADDGLADSGRGGAVLMCVDVGGHHLGKQVGREVGRRADTARRRRSKLQIVNALDVADAACMLCCIRRVAPGGEFLGGQ